MKILQITPYFYPNLSGVGTYVLSLIQSLAVKGHQIDVLTINTEDSIKEEILNSNIKVYRCSQNFKYREVSISFELIKRIFKAKNYNVCHIHVPFTFGLELAITACKINHLPLVVTHHGEGATGSSDFIYSILSKLYNLYAWFSRNVSLKHASRIIFLTHSYPESLRLCRKINDKIRIVRPSVNIDEFSSHIDGSKLRVKYGFDDCNIILLFVGSLAKSHKYKGVDYLIKAVHSAIHINEALKLVIVGDGELVPELKNLTQSLNIEQNVIFAGSIPHEQLAPYYAMSDIFILPSISGPESCGLVVLEAMASEKPVIVSDLPGVKDNVIHNLTGMIIPPKDIKYLTDEILRLSYNGNLRKEIAKNARTYMEDNFRSDFSEEIETVYMESIQ